MSHKLPDEQLVDMVCSPLPPEARAWLEAERVRAPALDEALLETEEALALLALGLEPVAPSAETWRRVQSDVEVGAWSRFTAEVGRVWDLAADEVRAVFERASGVARWEPGPVAGVWLFHLEGGPATAGADVGLIRFEAGTRFPTHGHGQEETYVVLQGRILDDRGTVEVPGDVVHNDAGLVHAYTCDPEREDTVIAITLRGGLWFPGATELW